MENLSKQIQELQKIIDTYGNIVFFGGAGVSTESGIPDFRSVDGLYHQQYDYPPETILSHTFYRSHTEEFFRFYQHPILFDRIDPIGQPPPFGADRKELLLAPQNLGRIDRPLRRIVAQLSTHPVDDHRHRILARLQRRLFAQHLHILRIAFQSRDTRRHLLRRGFGGTRCDQHRQKEKSFTHHLHHFRKNNCTSPKISKRPSNINIVFENFITAGRSE